ncbi:TPA: IS1 family transposase, partial [Raoultella ornithinolytica]
MWDIKHGRVLACTYGPQANETCRELLAMLPPFTISMTTTDDCKI